MCTDGRSNRAIAEYLRLTTSDINARLASPLGHSVNLTILDSGGTQARTVANAFTAVRSVNAIGLLGEATSSLTVPLALVAQELGLYTCSGSATATTLSEQQVFGRSFFRTIAADDVQGVALAQFVKAMKWNACVVLASSSTYGRSIAKVFQSTAAQIGLLVAAREFVEFGDGDADAESASRDLAIARALQVAAESGVRVFVFMGVAGEFLALGAKARDMGLIGPEAVWIGSEGVGELSEIVNTSQAQSLVTRASAANLPSVTSMEPYAAFFVDCYWALANMFVEMLKAGTAEADVLGRNVRLPVAQALKPFDGITGRVAFGGDGSRLSAFSMFNMFDGKTVEAATIDASGAVRELAKPRFFSGSSTPPVDRPEAFIAYVRYATAGGILFMVVTAAIAMAVCVGAVMVVMHRHSIYVREYGLGVLLTVSLGLVVLLLASVAWLDEQTLYTCNGSLWGSSIGLQLMLLPLLYRTFRTWRLSENILLWKRPAAGNKLPLIVITNLFLLQIAFLTLWTLLFPLQPKPFSSTTSFSFQCRSADSALHMLFTSIQISWHLLLLLALVYLTSSTRSLRTPARTPRYVHFVAINFALCAAVALAVSIIQVPSFALGGFWIDSLVKWYTVIFTLGMVHGRVLQQSRNASRHALSRASSPADDTMYALLAEQYGHLGGSTGPSLAAIPGKQHSMVGRFAVKFPGALSTWNQHQFMFALDEGYFGVTKAFGQDAALGQVWRIAHVGARKASGMEWVVEVLVEGKVVMWIQANGATQFKQLLEMLPAEGRMG
ncbi:periplasmic binding protein-like I [Catenaria anguillulae PL171]|uniref:Periplasmic binding protein-like I n=1 Tax=Catenaria anguillulae PL171 TaxID=765915 RepID=A0A1Y2HLS6_9FUNG|nr:periplasmic binding protein-like I [Catenaria anguillulae PL171]